MNFHSPKHQNQSRGDKCISQAAHVKTKINNHWLANFALFPSMGSSPLPPFWRLSTNQDVWQWWSETSLNTRKAASGNLASVTLSRSAWEIPWAKELGRLQSSVVITVRHKSATEQQQQRTDWYWSKSLEFGQRMSSFRHPQAGCLLAHGLPPDPPESVDCHPGDRLPRTVVHSWVFQSWSLPETGAATGGIG